jgi:hypothetical protein
MSTRIVAGAAAVAICLLLCLAVAVGGFAVTGVLEKGLFAAWDRDSLRRFATFMAVAVAVLAAAARTRAPRAAFGLAALAWSCLAFGAAAVLAAAAVIVSALGLGSVLTGPGELRERFGRPLGALLSLAAGLAGIQGLIQVLAHFPVNTPSLYGLLAVLAAWAGRWWLLADARALVEHLRAPVERRSRLAAPALMLGVLSLHTVHAALPERMFDAVALHLAVPTYVASHGQWSFDPWRWNWALMPMGAHWLYTASYLLGGEAATRLLNVSLHGAVVVLLYLELRERLGGTWAAVLAALCSATPLAFLQSASLYVENTLSLMVLAASILLWRSWRRNVWYDGALLGLLVGAALATKLLAAFAALALVPLAAWSLARSLPPRRLALAAGTGVLAALATGGVPYLYAWAAAGNPVLPMLNGVFRSPVLPPYDFPDTRWMGHLRPSFLFDATFRSDVFGELLAGSFGFQHLLLLPAGLLAMALFRKQAPWTALAIALVYCAGVLANMQYLRYLYPAFPLLALVEAEAVRAMGQGKATARVAMALVLAALVANVAFMPTSGWVVIGFHTEALFSAEARDRLLDQTIPQRRLLRAATALDGRNVRVLQIGNPVGLDVEGEVFYANLYSYPIYGRLYGARTEEDVDRLIADLGVNYVLRDQTADLPAAARSYLARKARPVHELGPFRLYRIRP